MYTCNFNDVCPAGLLFPVFSARRYRRNGYGIPDA